MNVRRAADNGDGAGGGTAPAASAPAAGGDAGKAPAAAETLLAKAGADGKAPEGTKVPESKATTPATVDYEKWAPKAVDGLKRDDKLVGQFRDAGKKLGLSGEQMQAMVDFDDARNKAMADEHRNEREQNQKTWRESFQNDKEFGGQKFKDTLADVERAMKKFADDDLRSLVEETGYGDHPALLKFVARIGKSMREDSIAGGAGGTGAKKPTLLDQLYPKPS